MYLDIKYTRLIVLLLGVFISGFIYWPIPYEEIDLINEDFLLKWSGSATLLSVITILILKADFKPISIWISQAYLLTIISRVISDSFFRDTAHNLFFFEVAFALFSIAPIVLLTAYLTSLIKERIVSKTNLT